MLSLPTEGRITITVNAFMAAQSLKQLITSATKYKMHSVTCLFAYLRIILFIHTYICAMHTYTYTMYLHAHIHARA